MVHTHEHAHAQNGSQRRLLAALVLTSAFAIFEAAVGWFSGSLTLLGDAGHMLTDSAAVGIGVAAAWLSQKPPSARHSYGFKRAEIIGALINVLFMVAIVVAIGITAIDRLLEPQPVAGLAVIIVGFAGLLVNLLAVWVLRGDSESLNVPGALLHVFGDLLGSVAALAAGAVIWWTGWMPIDPILSIFIGLLILVSSVRLLREILHVLMEGVPPHVDLDEVARAMVSVNDVVSVHDLHVWSLGSRACALSAHVRITDMRCWPTALDLLKNMLGNRFALTHTTL
ncbi:MAG: cation transporter [Gammaproteobacteria bacterium]|nr:cation transporter [Gammaproteobacteria bacterium]